MLLYVLLHVCEVKAVLMQKNISVFVYLTSCTSLLTLFEVHELAPARRFLTLIEPPDICWRNLVWD